MFEQAPRLQDPKVGMWGDSSVSIWRLIHGDDMWLIHQHYLAPLKSVCWENIGCLWRLIRIGIATYSSIYLHQVLRLRMAHCRWFTDLIHPVTEQNPRPYQENMVATVDNKFCHHSGFGAWPRICHSLASCLFSWTASFSSTKTMAFGKIIAWIVESLIRGHHEGEK